MTLPGCRSRPGSPAPEAVRRSQPLLGTYVTITAYGPDRDALQQAVSAAFQEVRRVDGVMSIHRPDSELSRVNRLAADEAVTVSAELFQVVAAARRISEQTDGSLDVAIRPLAELWGFIWKEYRFPTAQELEAVLPLVDYNLIQLDAVRRTISFRRSGVSIDLGGIAKGYAVDAAVAQLGRLGITNALVKAGGDLRVVGAPPGRDFWTVQIEDPRKQGQRVLVPLRDAALSTSGDYENFFERDGRRYSHVLDPRTGMPVEGVAACTVIAPSCMESDAWATACMVYGVDRSLVRFGDRMAIRFTVVCGTGESSRLEVRQSGLFPTP